MRCSHDYLYDNSYDYFSTSTTTITVLYLVMSSNLSRIAAGRASHRNLTHSDEQQPEKDRCRLSWTEETPIAVKSSNLRRIAAGKASLRSSHRSGGSNLSRIAAGRASQRNSSRSDEQQPEEDHC